MNTFAIAIRDDGSPGDPAIAGRLNHYADIRPLTIDGRTWIVARARIDDRAPLERALQMQAGAARSIPDAELILRAFHTWGHRCVEHLLGDFAFVIWTSDSREFLAARDHLGVEMLYYARVGGWIVAANTIAAIRAHPGVSDDLDDAAVTDFLLFEHKTDTGATTFKDIRTVPPAHALSRGACGGLQLHRYWEFPIDEPRYRRDDDYVNELRELVDAAVADRVRGGRASVSFSGGVDSSIVAGVARRHAGGSGGEGLRLFSFTYRSLLEDDEPSFAGAAAHHLGLRWDEYVVDQGRGWNEDLTVDTPEPHLVIGGGAMRRCYADMASFSPVTLSGEGPDNALFYEWRPYVAYLLRRGRWRRLTRDAAGFLRHERRLPNVGAALARRHREEETVSIPPWMAPALAKELDINERIRYVMRPATSAHPTRPLAHFSFSLPLWPHMFERLTPAYTHAPIYMSHPLADLRVLRFLMSVPVIPWCRNKYLLRRTFRDELTPTSGRAKTPLRADPAYQKILRDGIPQIVQSPRLERYAIAAPMQSADPQLSLAALRLAALSRWLETIDRAEPAAAMS